MVPNRYLSSAFLLKGTLYTSKTCLHKKFYLRGLYIQVKHVYIKKIIPQKVEM